MTKFRPFQALAAGLLLFAIAACDNAEERAQGHYERGMAYLDGGEPEKAALEFRNALQLDADAVEPRVEFARLLMTSGQFDGAVGHFLKVIDLDADHLEARVNVGRIFLQAGELEAATEHVTAAMRIAPQDPDVRGLAASLKQRQGLTAEAEAEALALLEDEPGDLWATLVLVQQKSAQGLHEEAVALLDRALAVSPDDFGLHIARLQSLEALDDQTTIGAQLERMATLFPDQPRVAQARVQWFLNQGDEEGAIAAQRALAGIFSDDPGYALDVAALLERFEGPEAARAELERLAAGEVNRKAFVRALADFDYRTGDTDGALAALAAFAEGDDLPEADRNDINAHRAGLLWNTGRRDEALALIDTVLASNGDHVDALRMRAVAAIENDDPEAAILDLRAALAQQPQDPGILMMLATAHERNGSAGLAQERLGLAVQVSGSGIAESLAYADFLMRQGKGEIAEDVLEDALGKRGEVLELLVGLGRTQLARSDWSGANVTVARLEALQDDEAAQRAAGELRLAVLGGQQKFEESIGLLRSMWEAEGDRSSALENLVRSYLQTGEIQKAKDFLGEILADEPKNLRANLLLGAVLAYDRDAAGAEAQYRKVIGDHPERANGYSALSALLRSQGQVDEADAVLREGIENAENAERLLFAQAARLEEKRDFDGAISIYEQLYAANKLSDVLANNLSSLLSEYRDDPESLERAHAIAKRLATSREPAFQDTYGWILYKRGEYERALPPLQAAAEGVPSNAIVQFHLGMVLAKLGQTDRATETLERALELGADSGLPQMEVARTTLEELRTN